MTSKELMAFTNPPSERTAGNQEIPNATPVTSPPPPRSQASFLENSNSIYDRALSDWRAPIEFYGRVVDENSKAVPGAIVNFSWTESPLDGGERLSVPTDAEGSFSLQGKHGPTLQVEIHKEGYYTSRSTATSFHYALANEIFQPDAANPVVFTLRKKGQGEPLIHVSGIGLRTMRDFLLPADGEPREVSLRDGRLAPPGQGDLRIEFHARPSLDASPLKISWQCQVTIPGGGLAPAHEEFPFLAPEDGYQASDKWSITATNWTEEVHKHYYVKLRDGNYGRVRLRVVGVPNRAYFRMESFLNPFGSRNLEPVN